MKMRDINLLETLIFFDFEKYKFDYHETHCKKYQYRYNK